jgi:hypothetical protein
MTYRRSNDEVPHAATLIREPSIVEELIFVFASIRFPRVSGSTFCRSALSAVLLSFIGLVANASAQTAPQLLPYNARLIAGGGLVASNTKGGACSRAVFPATTPATSTSSGFVSTDTYGDGCLATELFLGAPRNMVTDTSGAIYFTDYNTTTKLGVVHRIDPVTGIVSAIAGGPATNPAAGATCSSVDSNKVIAGDVFADGCLATSVRLQEPTGLAFSPVTGDLYIADELSHDVRKMSMSNGGVATVVISNGGSGYATAPTVTFSAPPTGGVQATGTAVLTGTTVTSVTITNAGSGYTSAPTVTFSIPGTGTNAATGTAIYTGIMTMAVGNDNGTTVTTSTSTSVGFTPGCSTAAGSSTPCRLDGPYFITFDLQGNLYINEEFLDATMVYNTNATGSTAVPTGWISQAGVISKTLTAGTMQYIAGVGTAGAVCTPGLTSSAGCAFPSGALTTGVQATASNLDSPYGIALDSYNNVYVADEFDDTVAQISAGTNLASGSTSGVPAAGIVTAYAGNAPPAPETAAKPALTTRGLAGSFGIGKSYGVAVDTVNNDNNLYATDATNFAIWRVDGATQTMYLAEGGASAKYTTASCGSSGPAANMVSIDADGDGCPSTSIFAGMTYQLFVDKNSNVYVSDSGDFVYRELATGAQFGNTGASQTDYIDVHFAAGDTPASTSPYTITTGSAIFTVGTPFACTPNTDNNGTASTEDCIIPVTASPTAPGPYSGVLTVKSTRVPGGTNFPLNGYFAISSVTRTALSVSNPAANCGATSTYSVTAPLTLTATLTANGPTPPASTDKIIFYSNGVALAPVTGVAVSNIGTTAAPVYGATLSQTFSTAGTYALTAQYIPTTGGYFNGSTSPSTSITTSSPTFSAAVTTNQQNTIAPGGTALYSFNVTAAVYIGTINFSCSGLPANSSCVFSPASITGTGCSVTSTVALNIYTQAPTVSMPAGFGGTGSGPWPMVGVFAGLVLAALIGVFRRRIPLRSGQLLMAIALLLAASGLTACSKAAGTPLAPGTSAFNGTVTVTATGSDGTISSFTVPLNVL